MEKSIDKCLALVRDWAEAKVSTGREPPWAWYQYMKLIETVSAIQTGRASVKLTPDSLRRASRRRPVAEPAKASIVDLDKPRRRRKKGPPPLPM
jgi:hypothetical protein